MDSCCLRWSEKCIRNSRNHRQRNPEKEGENPNEEGLCVQYMHMGTFDEEPRTVVLMGAYFEGNGPAGEEREYIDITSEWCYISCADRMSE